MNAELQELGGRSGRERAPYGVRRQSEAATALWYRTPLALPLPQRFQSGVALRLPPHSIGAARLFTLLLLLCSLQFVSAATNDPTTALQKGLFEEEANHDLDAAITAYQSVITQFDKDRKLAATAVFRLGECYRKQGKTNEANAQYERVLREFADQAPLVTLSRSYLAAAGPAKPSETAAAAAALVPTTAAEAEEVKRIQALIKDSPDLINAKDGSGQTPLHRAAAKGERVVAQFLLDNGAEVDARDRSGNTPLQLAVGTGNRALAELLLAHHANVQAADQYGTAPLHIAAQKGYRSLLEFLLDHKAEVNARTKAGSTPLYIATANGFKAVSEVLLARGAEVNARVNSGDTSLHVAAERGNQALAELLLANKADVNAMNQNGETPLFAAAVNGQLAVATLLLAQGAEVDLKGPSQPYGWTPLVAAVNYGHKDMVALLLKHKANPNVRFHTDKQNQPGISFGTSGNVPGYTPLLLATVKNLPDITELLLNAKADPNLKSDTGALPIFNVLFSPLPVDERNRLAKLLLEHGADPNVTTPDASETPLLIAALQDNKDLVKLLLAYKANPNAKVGDWTALHSLAANSERRNLTAVATLLLDAGANINALTSFGKTPLQLVAKGTSPSQIEMAALLRQRGGVEQMPDFTSLILTRKGLDNPIVVFRKDTNGLNSFTLLETLGKFYIFPTVSTPAGPSASFSDRLNAIMSSSSTASLFFPDLSHIKIRRPAPGNPSQRNEIIVNLLTNTNSIDCSKDVSLQFGDLVEVPEREHTLAESPVGLTAQQDAELRGCVARKVKFIVKSQSLELPLDGCSLGTYLSRALKRQEVQSILRSSSDFSRVHITRTAPDTRKTREIIEDVRPFLADDKAPLANDLWLRNGDVVEVPDK